MSTTSQPVRETDIVVVGGGGAGLAAAIEAAAAGAKVILLEKEPVLGGTTGRSVGSITASGTRLQKSAGIADSTLAHFEDMPLFAPHLADRDNPELRRLLVENVPDAVAWLERLGVVFFGPMPEPPHRVPRMHNILPSSKSYIHYLEKEARRLGVEFVVQAKAETLTQQAGRVSGVDAVVSGARQAFRARRAVILASGDMSSGRELKQKYLPDNIRDIEGINIASTGDGQRLGMAVGGCLVNGDIVFGPEIRFVAPPAKKIIERIPPTRLLATIMKQAMRFVPSVLLRPFFMMFVTTNLAPSHSLFKQGAILVNTSGRRFVDENDRPQYAIPAQPDQVAFIVFDENVAKKYTQWPNYISTAPGLAYAYLDDYRKNRRDIYVSAPTLHELAVKLGMNPAALTDSVATHNDAARAAGKPTLSTGPFYALGPAKSWIPIAEGGLAVDLNLRVLDQAGAPIAGLYAAGSTGQGGVILEGHGHHLAWAFATGRIAGRHAARSAAA